MPRTPSPTPPVERTLVVRSWYIGKGRVPIGVSLLVWFGGVGFGKLGDWTPVVATLFILLFGVGHLALFPELPEQPGIEQAVFSPHVYSARQHAAFNWPSRMMLLQFVNRLFQQWYSRVLLGTLEGAVVASISGVSACCLFALRAALLKGYISPWGNFRAGFALCGLCGVAGTLVLWLFFYDSTTISGFPPCNVSFASSMCTWLAMVSAGLLTTPWVRQQMQDAFTVVLLSDLSGSSISLVRSERPEGDEDLHSESIHSTATPTGMLRRLKRSENADSTSTRSRAESSTGSFPLGTAPAGPCGRACLPRRQTSAEQVAARAKVLAAEAEVRNAAEVRANARAAQRRVHHVRAPD
jgi:hypothetical protein